MKNNLEDNLEKKTEKNLEKSLNKKIEKDLDKKLNKKMDKKAEIKIKTKLRMNYILMALFIIASVSLMLFINYFQKVLNVSRTASGIIIFIIISIIFLLYGLVLKKHKETFKNNKLLFGLIIIVSIVFALIIPTTSRDVYSYIANGWTSVHYNENPYEVTVNEVEDKYNVDDEMFSKMAPVWKNEPVTYGPIWGLGISGILSYLSFGNINVALALFKISAVLVHLACCILIWKITKKKIWCAIYGLNPFILFEALTDVQNDLYIALFILLTIYFAVKKKNLFLAVMFVAIGTLIKYVAIFALPFIVLYLLKEKSIKQKFIYGFMSLLEFFAIIIGCYLICFGNLEALANPWIQQSKYNSSIMYVIYTLSNKNMELLSIIEKVILAIFVVSYVAVVFKLIFKPDKTFSKTMRKYYIFIVLFTLVIMTNFNRWYLLWLFPTIFLIRGKHVKLLLYFSYATLASIFFTFYILEIEKMGDLYITLFILLTLILVIIDRTKDNIKLIRNKSGKNI